VRRDAASSQPRRLAAVRDSNLDLIPREMTRLNNRVPGVPNEVRRRH